MGRERWSGSLAIVIFRQYLVCRLAKICHDFVSQALCAVYPNLFLVDALSLTDFLHSVCSCVLFFSVLLVLLDPLFMNLRSKSRIDYAVYHRTGEKVPKMERLRN